MRSLIILFGVLVGSTGLAEEERATESPRVKKLENRPKKSAAKWGGLTVAIAGVVLGLFKGVAWVIQKIHGEG